MRSSFRKPTRRQPNSIPAYFGDWLSKPVNQAIGINVARVTQRTDVMTGPNLTFVGYFADDFFPESLPATLAGTTTLTVGHAGTSTIEEFLTSSFAWPGHSGSPVFSDGEVVGLIDAMITGAVALNSQPLHSGMNRVVKGEHLRALLSSVK
jgi:hypothetical protein